MTNFKGVEIETVDLVDLLTGKSISEQDQILRKYAEYINPDQISDAIAISEMFQII